MKTSRQIFIFIGIVFISLTIGELFKTQSLINEKMINNENNLASNEETKHNSEKPEQKDEEIIKKDPIVYEGMTMNELSDKLNRSLGSTLEGQGYAFASQSIELGIDPYLAVAIVLHETGCRWTCSYLVRACNNVGGQKGGPACDGGSYKSYPTLEEGIRGYLLNLSNGYINQGLITPESIGPKYAASTTWAEKINWYIADIKAK